MFEHGGDTLLVIVNVCNRCRDLRINHIDRALDICCALGITAVLVLERLNAIDDVIDCELPMHSFLRFHSSACTRRTIC